ncbi:Alpha-1,2-mannosyltransferase ALG9 [Trichinella pseudospiralis]|uniref:Alpha-1,2-mannosyltransferase ALG9 n=1 Tax=Trichinella pseudospiralis TaxID=6337 RepID=A0A0V1JUH8_TRIPS|nr:Alpha-1,2-mannosyltransferase ALG9 [Trichinella pseudospiralis]
MMNYIPCINSFVTKRLRNLRKWYTKNFPIYEMIFLYQYCQLWRRTLSWAAGNIEVERLFTAPEVQSLLKKLTDVVPEKLFSHRQISALQRPVVKLMTENQLNQAYNFFDEKSRKLLSMPPMLTPASEAVAVLAKDADISCHDTSKFVFIDIESGLKERERTVAVREPNGELRTASKSEKDRMIRAYYPKKYRCVKLPKVFQTPYIEEALSRNQHLFVLEWACVQFEPDDPNFVRVCKVVYDDLNSRELWWDLQSTRFYGPMVFYLCLNKIIDSLLMKLLRENRLEAACDLVSLYNLVHANGVADVQEKHIGKELLWIMRRRNLAHFQSINRARKGELYVKSPSRALSWLPIKVMEVCKTLIFLRISAALLCPIMDCDEVYNYWEPVHMLVYGSGMQTWEYSPQYAIRSYAFLLFFSIPAKLMSNAFSSKLFLFTLMRVWISAFTIASDILFAMVICKRLSSAVGFYYLIFQSIGCGSFLSGAALLPSSLAMAFTSCAYAAWLSDRDEVAVWCIAASALLCWPFAALLGLPIALHMIFCGQWRKLFIHTLASGSFICAFMIPVDSYFFGRLVIAPLNIILYNVFGTGGPNLYGTEPLSFYVKNLWLNWNVVFLMSVFSTPGLLLLRYRRLNDCVDIRKVWPLYTGWTLWILVFFTQPHKEERFLFPVYPLLCATAAIGMETYHRLLKQLFGGNFCSFFQFIFTALFFLLSVSRIINLTVNFDGPSEVYKRIPHDFVPRKLCVGKEWYRFPSSFYLPDNVQLHFLKSEFSGQLPKPFVSEPLPARTRLIPTDMHDDNREELSRYVQLNDCDFLVDLSTNRSTRFEPDYMADRNVWKMIYSKPFLLLDRCSRWLRSYYVPILQKKHCSYGNYAVLSKIR